MNMSTSDVKAKVICQSSQDDNVPFSAVDAIDWHRTKSLSDFAPVGYLD